MKKIILGMLVVLVLFFVACDEDDGTKADLKWKNQSNQDLAEIKWEKSLGQQEDQKWEGDFNGANGETDFKGIKELSGVAEGADSGGGTYTLEFDTNSQHEDIAQMTANSATVKENGAAIITLGGATAK